MRISKGENLSLFKVGTNLTQLFFYLPRTPQSSVKWDEFVLLATWEFFSGDLPFQSGKKICPYHGRNGLVTMNYLPANESLIHNHSLFTMNDLRVWIFAYRIVLEKHNSRLVCFSFMSFIYPLPFPFLMQDIKQKRKKRPPDHRLVRKRLPKWKMKAYWSTDGKFDSYHKLLETSD